MFKHASSVLGLLIVLTLITQTGQARVVTVDSEDPGKTTEADAAAYLDALGGSPGVAAALRPGPGQVGPAVQEWLARQRRELLGEPFPLDTDLSLVPAEESQLSPEMAFGASSYLVVWADNRAGDFYDVDNDVYATRVSPGGEVLDPLGIQISANAGVSEQEPSVAFDGTNFLVVWSDARNAGYDIYGARVSQDGVVLDPQGILICSAVFPQILTGLAFNGTHYLAAWADYRTGNYDVYGARIAPDGTVLEPNGFPIYSAANNQAYVSVTSNGDGWLLSWGAIGGTVIRGARVAADGTALDPGGILIATGPNDRLWPDVGHDGSNYFLVWQDRRSGTDLDNWSVYGARVSSAGVVLDPGGVAIAADDSRYEGLTELHFDGTNYLVGWKDGGYGELAGARMSPDGTVLFPGRFPITDVYNYENFHALGHDGGNWLMVWEDFRGYLADPPGNAANLVGARIDALGNVLETNPDDIPIASSATWQFHPTAAFDGANHLALWQERTAVDEWDLRGARVSAEGDVLDAPALSICTEAGDQVEPELAFGATNYLAVWKDRRNQSSGEIYAARVGPDGGVLDPSGILVAGAGAYESMRYPAVAFGGTNFLVVWWQYASSDFEYHIYGARVAEDGTVLDPGGFDIAQVATATGWNHFVDVSIAFDGVHHLVVWAENKGGGWDIYGTRVSPSGVVIDGGGFPVSSHAGDQSFPDVTFAGDHWLAVWTDARNGGEDIYGARIDAGGTVLDPTGIALTTAGEDQSQPDAGFDGIDYVVVWSDERAGTTDVYGARMTQAGDVLEPGGVAFVTGDYDQEYPSISGGLLGGALVVHDGYEPETHRATRAWASLYTSPTTGADFPTQLAGASLGSYPNPFRGKLRIPFTLARPGRVKVEIFDISGRRVRGLLDGERAEGRGQSSWDGRDDSGHLVAPGIYCIRFEANGQVRTGKAILIR